MVLWKKTMVLWKKNYGTMEKTMILWKKTHDTIPKTMKLWFTMEKTMVLWKKKLWYYSKLLFTTVNYSLLWYFLLGTKSCSAVIPMIPRILEHTVFLKIITYIFVYSQLYHWYYHQVKSHNWCSTFILMILKVNTLDQCRCTKRTKG